MVFSMETLKWEDRSCDQGLKSLSHFHLHSEQGLQDNNLKISRRHGCQAISPLFDSLVCSRRR